MHSPQAAHGDHAMADVNVKLALDILTNTLPMYGSDSEKGQAILDSLRKLGKIFSTKLGDAKQLQPTEIASLLQASGQGQQPPLAGGAPPPGGMPPGMPGMQ